MKAFIARIGAFAVLLSAAGAPLPAFSQDDPAALVRGIYQGYIANERKIGKEPDMYNPRYYSARINRQIAALKKACSKRDDLCMPDADFLVDGQDFQIRNLKVDVRAKDAAKATVVATFTNFGSARTMTFSMVLERGRWAIDEMKATSKEQPEGYTLSEMLKPNPQ